MNEKSIESEFWKKPGKKSEKEIKKSREIERLSLFGKSTRRWLRLTKKECMN